LLGIGIFVLQYLEEFKRACCTEPSLEEAAMFFASKPRNSPRSP